MTKQADQILTLCIHCEPFLGFAAGIGMLSKVFQSRMDSNSQRIRSITACHGGLVHYGIRRST